VVIASVYRPGANDRDGAVIALVAGAMSAATLGAFYLAVQYGDLSVVAPIGSVGAIVPVAVGLVQGERPGALQLVGLPLALAGAVLAARAEAAELEHEGLAPHPGRRRQRLCIAFAVLSAATGGVFLTLSAHAAAHGAIWSVLWSRISLVTCTGVVIVATRRPILMPALTTLRATVPGLLLVTGTTLFAVASTKGLLAVVSVLASLSPVVTVAMAVVLLQERLTKAQWCGVGAAITGVVLLASG
ncbi:MAG: EamA family transporter, partial [Mycobacteriales bacterium]